MTFNPNLPNPTDLLSQSQVDLKANNAALNASFGRNHVPFATATNNGKHTFIEMPISAAIPTPVPGLIAGEGTIYTKNATTFTATTEATLYYTPDASTNEYQLTRTISSKFSNFGTNLAYGTPPAGFTQTGGWTFLPGGLLFQYGFFGQTAALGGSGTIQFPIAFTTAVFSITDSLNRTSSGNQSITINTVGLTSFTFLSSSTSSDGIYWHAIGK